LSFVTDRIYMAEETIDSELAEYSVEVSHEKVEYFGCAADSSGEVSYYTVASDCDYVELMPDDSSSTGDQCDDVCKDEITILAADGHFITDGAGHLIHCDVDGTDAAANGQPVVFNVAHPLGMHNLILFYQPHVIKLFFFCR